MAILTVVDTQYHTHMLSWLTEYKDTVDTLYINVKENLHVKHLDMGQSKYSKEVCKVPKNTG